MTEPIPIIDRRGSRSASGLYVRNLDAEMRRLRHAGVSLPNSPAQARVEAKRLTDAMGDAGNLRRSVVAAQNRTKMASMRRAGANTQMALPKIRQPLGSLIDKGIPFNVSDEKERRELVRWCRLFYSTHDLIPLLVDIYSKFPVVGMEFQHKDPKIRETYEDMFLDKLNYEEFLPDGLGREYFIAGEATAIGHFNESLAVWSGEEILNPDMVRVSKSIFVEEERVQLLVKEMVENLRNGPSGLPESQESPSERLERNFEYQSIVKYYPEFLQAASQDDGIDISEAIWSRLVNKAAWWDLRGTPHLLRSFRTLLSEESLNAAQDAVADRLYAPMVVATLGIENMGDGQPWIPDPDDLDDLRDDFQNAFAADFKFIAHNMGLKVESVFGRESVPNFSDDYDRIDAKLMQAWGIGQALIMGGTGGGGTYASSAINREVCEQLMFGFQRKVNRHMKKRMEIIAEAQEHWDYEISTFQRGLRRTPIYREIVQEDPETGEERIIRVPKLAYPDVRFSTLNLRDEQTERAFVAQLKQMGVPVSDGTLAVNIPIEFKEELERSAEETVEKMVADAQAIKKAQELCDAQNLPYPDDLASKLQATLNLRIMLAQTDMAEDQAKMANMQAQQMAAPAASQMGLLPQDGQPPANDGSQLPPPPPPPEDEGEAPDGLMPGPLMALPPGASAPMVGDPGAAGPPEPLRNRARPPESDEMRGQMPMASARYATRVHSKKPKKGEKVTEIRRRSKLELGPSSVGHSTRVTEDDVERAITAREKWARSRRGQPDLGDLVQDSGFYQMLNMRQYERQIQADWPEIRNGGAEESRKLLEEMVDQYETITGIHPTGIPW